MPTKPQASPISKGEGRKLRRARNMVKKWEADYVKFQPAVFKQEHWDIRNAIYAKRYERACALILAAKLRNS